MFRFSLSAFLLSVAALCLVVGYVVQVFLPSRPIAWSAFSAAKADELVREGNRVLVFCNPSYHGGSSIAAKSFDHPEVVRAFHDGQFKALRLDYGDWQGQEIRNIFRQHGHTKHPMVFLYNADGTVQRLEAYSADHVVTHLGIPGRSMMPGWPYAAGFAILFIATAWRSRNHADERPQSVARRLAYATEQTDELKPE